MVYLKRNSFHTKGEMRKDDNVSADDIQYSGFLHQCMRHALSAILSVGL